MSRLIVAIAESQDRTAFASLFTYYAPRVKAYLCRHRIEDRQAEDIAQEVMLTVWRKAGLFDPAKSSAGTWIYTIARNRLVDTIRREKRPDDLDPTDPALAPSEPAQADEQYETRVIGERVRTAMTDLPHEQAEVLQLSFVEGLAHSAIAERLDIPLGTVKSRLRLAFARLRPVMQVHRAALLPRLVPH